MLLLRGENLNKAEFSVRNAKVKLSTTKISQNGHWAFLHLDTTKVSPGTVQVTIKNALGSTVVPYQVEARTTGRRGPQGVSSHDSIYLIMPDRFADGDPQNDRQPGMPFDQNNPHAWHGGDLEGVRQHLDYLKDLGISTVWLTPVQQNHEPDSYHGYGATDSYAVDSHFGGLGDLKMLAATLHQQGMKLVLDTVPNHVGPAHPWVDDSPTPDWFHGTKASHRPASGVFPALMDPHATKREVSEVQDGWFVDLLPDLNQETLWSVPT